MKGGLSTNNAKIAVFLQAFLKHFWKLKQNSFYPLCIHSAVVGGIPRSPTLL